MSSFCLLFPFCYLLTYFSIFHWPQPCCLIKSTAHHLISHTNYKFAYSYLKSLWRILCLFLDTPCMRTQFALWNYFACCTLVHWIIKSYFRNHGFLCCSWIYRDILHNSLDLFGNNYAQSFEEKMLKKSYKSWNYCSCITTILRVKSCLINWRSRSLPRNFRLIKF